MHRILAIAQIALRNAIRSRVMLTLLCLLLLAVIGLPLTIKGDGTLRGDVQILLTYTLAAVGMILAVATVWAGCAAVSQEIQEKQIQLIVTKPVRRIEIWLGKWLGLLALNAALLAVAGATIYGMLRWHTRPANLTETQQTELREQILVARRVVWPTRLDVEADARRFIAERQARNELPADQPLEQVFQAVRESLLNQAYTVPTGYKRAWTFELPHRVSSERPVALRYRFSSSQTVDAAVQGIWLVGRTDSPDREQFTVFNVPEGEHTIVIPAAVFGDARTVVIEYANVNPFPVAVLFNPTDGLRMLIFEGTFAGNFLRSLAVVFCQLAFFAALATTAGTLFSLPVAALMTGYVLLLIKIGDYLQKLSGDVGAYFAPAAAPGAAAAGGSGIADAILRGVVAVQGWVVRPLQSANPLERLAGGELVGWEWVGFDFAVRVVLYSGVLALVSGWLFNRREIGLPS